MGVHKKIVFFFICISIASIVFLDARLPSKLYKNFNHPRKQSTTKTVLYWTKMFENKTFYFGEGDVFQTCEVSACRATYDRNFMRIEDFDAILFHGIEVNISDLPLARSTKQKYVFADMESPQNWPLDPALIMDEFYNWTMSYRRDSDIVRPYAYIFHSVTKDIVYPVWARTDAVASQAYEGLRSPINYTSLKDDHSSSFNKTEDIYTCSDELMIF